MPKIDPKDLVGSTFHIPKEDGQRMRGRIVNDIDEHDGKLQRDSTTLKFICSTKDDVVEDLFTCNEILDHIKNSEDDDLIEWKLKSIASHEGPLTRSHSN